MDFEQIRLEVEEGVATITLDRPERLNAFTPKMMSELIEAFDRCDGDDGVRAVIVTGEGRGFCAGADLEAGGATFDARERPGFDNLARMSRDMRITPTWPFIRTGVRRRGAISGRRSQCVLKPHPEAH